MYNEQLASAILAVLKDAFPNKLQLNELKSALPDFSSLDEKEWLTAVEALEKDRLIEGRFIRAGFHNALQVVANLEISAEGRRWLSQAKPAAVHPKAEDAAVIAHDSRKVFVVHGHDDGVKQSVARLLERLDLEPVILHERPNKGRTVIEKFEAHADVSFAVVLLTPDDVGGLSATGELRPRARQNVILELGYFIGKLGRARVCAIYAEGVEIPSDIHGVLYIPLDASDGWRLKLASEIRAAGITVDLNRV